MQIRYQLARLTRTTQPHSCCPCLRSVQCKELGSDAQLFLLLHCGHLSMKWVHVKIVKRLLLRPREARTTSNQSVIGSRNFKNDEFRQPARQLSLCSTLQIPKEPPNFCNANMHYLSTTDWLQISDRFPFLHKTNPDKPEGEEKLANFRRPRTWIRIESRRSHRSGPLRSIGVDE